MVKKGRPSLNVTIGKIKMKNPVMVASGTFGYGQEVEELVDLKKLGAIVTKSITLKPKEGNPPPRTTETAAGMINSIGLENDGIDSFIQEKLPFLKKQGVPVIASIAGERISDFVGLAKRLDGAEGVNGVELNISCPNIEYSGIGDRIAGSGKKVRNPKPEIRYPSFAQNAQATYEVVRAVKKVTRLTIIAKLSPNVTDIVSIAKSACRAGTDALSLINTLLAIAVDGVARRPKLTSITGGLSGPAIKPVALRMVWQVASEVKVPIIGMGGVMDAADALEFLIAGATAVAVGTGNFVNPKAPTEIIAGLASYMRKKKINSVKQLIGSLKC